MTNAAQLALRIFNLSEETAEVQLENVTLFQKLLAIPPEGSHFFLEPGKIKKLELFDSPVTIYAPRWPIRIHIVSGADSFDLDLNLRRQKVASYLEAIVVDRKAPESVAAFKLLPTPEPRGGSTACD